MSTTLDAKTEKEVVTQPDSATAIESTSSESTKRKRLHLLSISTSKILLG